MGVLFCLKKILLKKLKNIFYSQINLVLLHHRNGNEANRNNYSYKNMKNLSYTIAGTSYLIENAERAELFTIANDLSLVTTAKMDTKTLRAKVTKFLTANPQPEVIEVVEVAEPVNEVKAAFNLEEDENPFLKDKVLKIKSERKERTKQARKSFKTEINLDGLTQQEIDIVLSDKLNKKEKILQLSANHTVEEISKILGVLKWYVEHAIYPEKRNPSTFRKSKEMDRAKEIFSNKELSPKTINLDKELYFESIKDSFSWEEINIVITKKLFFSLFK